MYIQYNYKKLLFSAIYIIYNYNYTSDHVCVIVLYSAIYNIIIIYIYTPDHVYTMYIIILFSAIIFIIMIVDYVIFSYTVVWEIFDLEIFSYNCFEI